MNKKYLVFRVDFSGVSDSLFSILKDKGLQIEEHTIPKIWRLYFYAIISTFSFNYKIWVTKAEKKYNLLQKTSWAFRVKSKWCAKIIKKNFTSDHYGIIQVSGTFDSMAYSTINSPFFILTDYTMDLAAQKQQQKVKPLLPPSKKELAKWYTLETSLYKRANKIIVPSEYINKSLAGFYSIEKNNLITIGYGSNLLISGVKAKEINVKKQVNLLFVGKMFIQKGGEELLIAFELLKKEYPNATFNIVGPRIDPCPGYDGVNYLGRIYDKVELAKLYNQADIFVIHSFYEAFGLVLLEAMAFGVPCVGSDIDAMGDILINSGAGAIAPLGESEVIKNKILHFIENPDEYKKASIAGIAAVNNYYNWQSVANKFYSVVTSND